jgi:hypothetical protein
MDPLVSQHILLTPGISRSSSIPRTSHEPSCSANTPVRQGHPLEVLNTDINKKLSYEAGISMRGGNVLL